MNSQYTKKQVPFYLFIFVTFKSISRLCWCNGVNSDCRHQDSGCKLTCLFTMAFWFFFSSILGKKPNLMSKLGSLQYQVKPDAILENRWVEMSNFNGNLSEDVSLECGIIFWYQWIKLWLYEKQEFGLKRYCIVERNLKAANYWEIKWLFCFGISQ